MSINHDHGPGVNSDNCETCDFSRSFSAADYRDKNDPGPGCFPYAARVRTPYGEVSIGALEAGDVILSYKNGKLIPRNVIRKLSYPPAEIFRIDFVGREDPILCTKTHSFLLERGWKSVDRMRLGERFVQMDGAAVVITKISTTNRKEVVFNLRTEGEQNIIVGGCIAHNFTYFRALRTWFHQQFQDTVPQVLPTTRQTSPSVLASR